MLNNLGAAYFYVGPAWELETHYLWYLRIHQLYRPIELKNLDIVFYLINFLYVHVL